METMSIIEKAKKAVYEHDFCWMYADYDESAKCSEACGHMHYFVGLLHQIDDKTIADALRTLWIARCKYLQKFSATEDDKEEYMKVEKEMLDIINPAAQAA